MKYLLTPSKLVVNLHRLPSCLQAVNGSPVSPAEHEHIGLWFIT